MARKARSAEETQDKQDEILTAAVAVFSEKGYAGATTSEVAKAAGVAEGTIFRYFKTKKDMLTAIVAKFATTVGGNLIMSGVEKILAHAEDKDLRVILKEILMDRAHLMRRMFPVLQVVLVEAMYHEEIRTALYQNVYLRAQMTVAPLLDRLEAEGSLRVGLARETVLRTILGAFAAFLAQSVLLNMDEAFFLQEADRTIDLLYHGLIRQDASSA